MYLEIFKELVFDLVFETVDVCDSAYCTGLVHINILEQGCYRICENVENV